MQGIFTVVLPDIGEGVVEGELIEWLVKEGETLSKDQPVVVVMTDKATVELPAPYPGVLNRCYYKKGEMAIKDRPLYDIEVAQGVEVAEWLKQSEKSEVMLPSSSLTSLNVPLACHNSLPSRCSSEGLAIPKVRHMAKKMGVDLSDLKGSGRDGRIVMEDLYQGIQKEKSVPVAHMEGDVREPLQGVRRVIAHKMLESKSRAAHCHFFDEVEVSSLLNHYKQMKTRYQGLTLTAFFIKALSYALQHYPEFNTSLDWSTQEIVIHKYHHIAVASKTPQGVMAPVIHHVEKMELEDIVHELNKLKEEIQAGTVPAAKMRGATVTLSNFGTEGGVFATPILNTPQSLILGLAKIEKKPVVIQDSLGIGHLLNLSWSFDHCLIDGHMIAAFSHKFKQGLFL